MDKAVAIRLLELIDERLTTRPATCVNVQDFANRLMAHNKELGLLGERYILRGWELNHLFVTGLRTTYPTFFSDMFVSDYEYLETDFSQVIDKARAWEHLKEMEYCQKLASQRTISQPAPAAIPQTTVERHDTAAPARQPEVTRLPTSEVASPLHEYYRLKRALRETQAALSKNQAKFFCTGCNKSGHNLQECWKHGGAEMSGRTRRALGRRQRRALRRKEHRDLVGREKEGTEQIPARASEKGSQPDVGTQSMLRAHVDLERFDKEAEDIGFCGLQ